MSRRLAALVVACAAVLVVALSAPKGTAPAQELAPLPAPAAPAATTAPKPTVVARQYVRPKRARILTTRFEPWAQPSPEQVRTIIAVEAARAGVQASALARRIQCESGFKWSATNGQYTGLGQF